MKSGIYLIRNTKNGKFYIGSAADLNERNREHFWYLRKSIRQEYVPYKVSTVQLGKKYGVSSTMISLVVNNKTWVDV